MALKSNGKHLCYILPSYAILLTKGCQKIVAGHCTPYKLGLTFGVLSQQTLCLGLSSLPLVHLHEPIMAVQSSLPHRKSNISVQRRI